eukprot:359937-Chlamydomonas_euryale.AAC.27
MAAAVRRGDMDGARAIGSRATVPLALTSAELHLSPEPISQGVESTVYSGVFRGVDVAVKRLKLSTAADLDRFRSELILLSQICHENVVSLLGAKALPPDYMMVLPLERYNLAHALYRLAWRPCWSELLLAGAEVADAMAQLHALGVVHR